MAKTETPHLNRSCFGGPEEEEEGREEGGNVAKERD